MLLSPLLAVADIRERLQTIFPEGTANCSCTRDRNTASG